MNNTYSTGEVAEIVGVTKRTLWNWLKDGRVAGPARNPSNGYLLWSRAEIDALLAVLRSPRRHS